MGTKCSFWRHILGRILAQTLMNNGLEGRDAGFGGTSPDPLVGMIILLSVDVYVVEPWCDEAQLMQHATFYHGVPAVKFPRETVA